MDLPNLYEQLTREFENYLKLERKVSQRTLLNYRSDLNHFLAWSSFHLKSQGFVMEKADQLLPHLTPFLFATYKGYHLENKIPYSTLNRRLSTMRSFSRFLRQSNLIEAQAPRALTNVREEKTFAQEMEKVLGDFAKHLRSQGASKTTLKNYLSDVRQFLAWVPQKQSA